MYYIIVHTVLDHHCLKPWNQEDVDCIKGIIKSEKIFREISLLIVFHQDLRGDGHVSTAGRQESMIMLCFKKKVDKK